MPHDDGRHIDLQRQALRHAALRRRQHLAREAGAGAGQRLKANGLQLITRLGGDMPPSAIIAGYVPVRGEIDVMPLLQALHARGHHLVLPVVERSDAPLVFRRHVPGSPLRQGRFGIPVPPPEAEVLTPHVVLVPLVAFDARGQRLGYGGGYYDRTLAHLRAGPGQPPVAIGCAHAGQQLPHIPALPTDAPLDWIITDRSIIRPGDSSQGGAQA